MYYNIKNFAQAYGEGAYSSTTYQNGTTSGGGGTTTTGVGGSTGSTGANGGSTLTNTGFDILIIATIACFVIFAALLVRLWRRPAKKPTA